MGQHFQKKKRIYANDTEAKIQKMSMTRKEQ
jgi:hypothetical protein